MAGKRDVDLLMAVLGELPKDVRERIVTEDFDLASGKEPTKKDERTQWYGAAVRRLLNPRLPTTVDDVLERAKEEYRKRNPDGREVGVLAHE